MHVASDTHGLFDALADALLASAADAVLNRGTFHLALSGGSTPEPFYVHLVIDPRYRLIPWKQTHLWLVDERCVPADDERSNFAMIRETLVEHVPLLSRQVHPIPVMDDAPADRYEAEVREYVPDAVFDWILLGMGDDAHTASLFPHSSAIVAHDRLVVANDGPHVMPPPRVSMTFDLINRARDVAVLVTGEGKSATLRCVAERLRTTGPTPHAMPITGVDPTLAGGRLTWYLDAAAAG